MNLLSYSRNMFGSAWLTFRQAQEAIKTGRLEEAQRLLSQPDLARHRRSWELEQRLVKAYAERGERHLRNDDADSAWRDLLRAEAIAPTHPDAVKLRQALSRLAFAAVRALLEAGEPGRALEMVSVLREERAIRGPELKAMEEAAREWSQAREQADRGEFAIALQAIDRIRPKLPPPTDGLEKFARDLAQRQQTFQDLLGELQDAVDARRWREVVRLADEVVAAAPQYAEAKRVRSRAWTALEPDTLPVAPPKLTETNPGSSAGPMRRFLLWVDGIGGYLVCLSPRVTFGQAAGEGPIDVPLHADLSRMHANLARDAEGYVLEASRPVQVNGRATERVLLQPGDRITLGTSCQLQFQQPVPVSATARLDPVSGHRLPLSVDGVILMADSLVIGPAPQAHVVIPGLKEPLILYRNKDGLGVRCADNFSVDGQKCIDRAALGPNSVVTNEWITFAVEPADRKK